MCRRAFAEFHPSLGHFCLDGGHLGVGVFMEGGGEGLAVGGGEEPAVLIEIFGGGGNKMDPVFFVQVVDGFCAEEDLMAGGAVGL